MTYPTGRKSNIPRSVGAVARRWSRDTPYRKTQNDPDKTPRAVSKSILKDVQNVECIAEDMVHALFVTLDAQLRQLFVRSGLQESSPDASARVWPSCRPSNYAKTAMTAKGRLMVWDVACGEMCLL